MGKWLSVAAICVIAAFVSAQGSCQEEEMEYGYGTVVKVDKTKMELTVSEYDWQDDTEVEVTVIYSLTADTEFENVGSIQDILPGAYVDIEFVPEGAGKKVARVISVYEPEYTE